MRPDLPRFKRSSERRRRLESETLDLLACSDDVEVKRQATWEMSVERESEMKISIVGAAVLSCGLALGSAASAQEFETIDDEAFFPEGPVFEDGALYYVEYADHTLMKWDGSLSEIWKRDGCGPSAAMPFQEDFLITCYDSGQIARVDKDGKTVSMTDTDSAGNPFLGPNDFALDGKGGVWMTASGPWESAPIEGKVYHIDADMNVEEAADDLHYANGIAAIGTTLYVNESEAARIVVFEIGDDNALRNRRLFVRLGQVDETSGPWAYPDGLEVGPDGNLWIGSYAMGRVVAISPDGTFVKAVDVPATTVPNLAFGPDGEMYLTVVDQTDAGPYKGRVLRMK